MFDKKKYQKEYYQKNKEEINQSRKEYLKEYNEEHREERLKYYKDNIKHILNLKKIYRATHQTEIKEQRKKYRIDLLNIVSNNNPHCVRCGCNDVRLLEINHKNGGGNKEIQGGKLVYQFYQDILKGRRKTDDLELLCRVCNSWHALELKYGKLPYKITYNSIKK